MPGMIGASSPMAAALPYDPSQMSGQDRLMMLSAMLKDAGASLRGDNANAQNVMAMRNLMLQRQMMNGVLGALGDPSQAQGTPQALVAGGQPNGPLSGDFGPNAPAPQSQQTTPLTNDVRPPVAGAPPAVGGMFGGMSPRALMALSFIAPQAAETAIKLRELNETAVGPNGQVYNKYDPSMVGQNLSTSQYLNGFKVNPNDPSSPTYIPTAPVEGAMPVRTPNGLDWVVPPGAQRALDIKNKAAIMRGHAALAEVPIAAKNAATGAAAQANTASQNVVALPPGFTPRRRPR